MTESRYSDALDEAQRLEAFKDTALYEQLGLRLKDIYNEGGYERSRKFSAEFSETAVDMGLTDDLLDFGKRWWKNLEPKLLELVCVKNHPEMKELTKDKTVPQIAATLATSAFFTSIAAPAWLIVVTTILAHRIIESGLDTLCEGYSPT